MKWRTATDRIQYKPQEALLDSGDIEDTTHTTSYVLLDGFQSCAISPSADGEETEGYLILTQVDHHSM